MYALGLDYGTNSARCVLLDLESGVETAAAVAGYPSGDNGIIGDRRDPHLARQDPADYLAVLVATVTEVMRQARAVAGFQPQKIVGIGVDTTGSTPLPVDKNLSPLASRPEFRGNPNALAWLWKDHTASDEAEEITALAAARRPRYLARIGGTYSAEWFFAKLLHLARTDPAVYRAMDGFIELCDYLPALLCGYASPREAPRGICAAGHKAMYGEEWGGLPDRDFLAGLFGGAGEPGRLLYEKAVPAGTAAGTLCRRWAGKLDLPAGIPVSVGAFDAHMGAVGAGVGPGVLVKVIGTSACDMTVAPPGAAVPDIPGICGIVPGSIVPGLAGIEAGQSAVGDIFHWFAATFMGAAGGHQRLTAAAAALKPGASGLLALDWHNGNRCVLVDQKLTGLVCGLTLNTRPAEVYRALIEATGFGARVIIERLAEHGVETRDIIATGGIPGKNPLLMQVYADITGRRWRLAASAQACAVGAAMFGAIAAGFFPDVAAAQAKVCRFEPLEYRPHPAGAAVYDRLYRLYRQLHDSFGLPGGGNPARVMKQLLAIREEAAG